MPDILKYITNRFNIAFDHITLLPIEVPNAGRNQLAEILSELNFKAGVEIGVAEGVYSETLAKANPQMKLYGIDPYTPHRGYTDYTRKSTFERLEKEAHERLDSLPNYKFIKKFSMEAIKDFPDSSIDFVYIDGDHSFQSVTSDVAEWSKKVKPNGIVAGHDYYQQGSRKNVHVYQVVNAYTNAFGIKPWFVLGADSSKSWFWVKQ